MCDANGDPCENGSTVSVIVPVYNDPQGIRVTLEALVAQNLSSDAYEVIVVDNNSSDETASVIDEYCDDYPEIVHYLLETRPGSYAARNTGINRATGSILTFIDADMTVDESWATDVIESFDHGDCDFIAFNVETPLTVDPTNPVTKYGSLARRLDYFPIETYISEGWAPTCCLSVRREVIETVGLFDDRMISSGDFVFGKQVEAAGFNQCFVGEVTMYHPPRANLRSQFSKSFRVGRGYVQLIQLHPELYDRPGVFDPRHVLPPHPVWVAEQLLDAADRANVSVAPWELVLFYILDYLNKLYVAYGRFYEYLSAR